MKKTLLISLCFLISTALSAQITFQKTYGGEYYESATCMVKHPEGGFLIIGNTMSYGGHYQDIYALRVNQLGEIMWTKTYGGPGSNKGNAVCVTNDSGFIITGHSYILNDDDIFVVRTDKNGDTLWTKLYGDTGRYDIGNSIHQTVDGGFLIGGLSGNNNQSNGILLRINSQGDKLWSRKFGTIIRSVSCTNNDEYIAYGDIVDFFGVSDLFWIKTNSLGFVIGSKEYGGSGQDQAHFMSQNPDSGFILGSNSTSFQGSMLALRVDANGDTLWTKTYDGDIDTSIYFQSISPSNDGGFIITGRAEYFDHATWAFTSKVLLVRTDSMGEVLWSKIYGGANYSSGMCLMQNPDSGYIISGHSNSFSFFDDCYLIRTDINGNSFCNEKNLKINSYSTGLDATNAFMPVGNATIIVKSTLTTTGEGGTENIQCARYRGEPGANNSLLLFPNPAGKNELIKVWWSEGQTTVSGKIEIFTITGQVYFETTMNDQPFILDIKKFTSGIYIVKVQTEKGSIVKKLIVQ